MPDANSARDRYQRLINILLDTGTPAVVRLVLDLDSAVGELLVERDDEDLALMAVQLDEHDAAIADAREQLDTLTSAALLDEVCWFLGRDPGDL